MNKWQIICPAVAILVAGIFLFVFVGLPARRSQERALQYAIGRHLGSALSELECIQQGGRLPSLEVARKVLNDEEVAKRVHITSLFGTDDLFYNPSQPLVGSNALVACARVGSRLVAICADRKIRNLSEAEFRQAGLMPLSDRPSQTQAEPRSRTNGTSP